MTSLNYNTCTEPLHRKCTLLQYNISLTYQSPQSLAKRDVHYCSTTSQSGMYTIAVQHRKAGCTLLQYNIAKRDVHYCSTTSQSGMYTGHRSAQFKDKKFEKCLHVSSLLNSIADYTLNTTRASQGFMSPEVKNTRIGRGMKL